jgi:hypothetical protein
MDISFTGHDGVQDDPFTLELDPAQMRGARTTFGAELYIAGVFKLRSGRPLAMSGVLAWETENGYGLQIPLQPVGGGSVTVTVPISDRQLGRVEARRAGGEPRFQLAINVLGTRANGETAMYKPWGPQNYTIPRDRWKDILAGAGYGKIHIIELPVPPDACDAWTKSAATLAEASVCYSQGEYGYSIGNSRNALQQMVDVLERALGIVPTSPAFGPRIEALTKRLKDLHEKHSFDPYVVLATVIKATFDFSSDPVHRGYEVPTREDAAMSLSLATALHEFLASRPLPKVELLPAKAAAEVSENSTPISP